MRECRSKRSWWDASTTAEGGRGVSEGEGEMGVGWWTYCGGGAMRSPSSRSGGRGRGCRSRC